MSSQDDLILNLRSQAWDYFALHAKQRMDSFQYFLVVAGLATGAVATLATSPNGNRAVAGVVALFLALLSFTFWKLDVRNRLLIKHAEAALKSIESGMTLSEGQDRPSRLQLFLYEEWESAQLKRLGEAWPWSAHFSYSTCFQMVFLIFGLGGLASATGLFVSLWL